MGKEIATRQAFSRTRPTMSQGLVCVIGARRRKLPPISTTAALVAVPRVPSYRAARTLTGSDPVFGIAPMTSLMFAAD